VVCPICGSNRVGYLDEQRRWQCSNRHSKRQFSIKVGTIMEDSPIGLDKWLPVLWLVANCRNGISSWEIHRDLGVTQKTAWFMFHRVRLAMQDEAHGGKLGGEIEVDETFIAGKARPQTSTEDSRTRAGWQRDVAAVLECHGKVRAKVVSTRRKPELYALVRENVEWGPRSTVTR
jgi:transposase-like protein